MLFFGKKKKGNKTVHFTKTFTQSESFKGFKRNKLTTYKEYGVGDTLAYFEKNGYNFEGCQIRLEYATVVGEHNTFDVVNVYVDDMRIGCRYGGHSQFDRLAVPNYDAAHIKVENDEVLLFLHYIN